MRHGVCACVLPLQAVGALQRQFPWTWGAFAAPACELAAAFALALQLSGEAARRLRAGDLAAALRTHGALPLELQWPGAARPGSALATAAPSAADGESGSESGRSVDTRMVAALRQRLERAAERQRERLQARLDAAEQRHRAQIQRLKARTGDSLSVLLGV